MRNILKGRGKLIAACVVALFVLAQLIRPARTQPPTAADRTLESAVHVPSQADAILKRSCDDCHSYQTRWPWYSSVAPTSWLVIRDVTDGRRHMNFSAWPTTNPTRAAHLLDHVCREVTSGDMPLWFYLPLHPDARLSPADVKTICQWTATARRQMGLPAAGKRP